MVFEKVSMLPLSLKLCSGLSLGYVSTLCSSFPLAAVHIDVLHVYLNQLPQHDVLIAHLQSLSCLRIN
jgi:hypothetical protein